MPTSADIPAVIVAGHMCLDVIPAFVSGNGDLEAMLVPGKLVEVGPPTVSAGGAVSNTGLALHRLGVPTRLMAKVGNDLFGDAILDVLRHQSEALTADMLVSRDESTSYTLVLNPPSVDRIFLHYPGVNDTYRPDEIPLDRLSEAGLFHFGYPPLMRQTYADGGVALALAFQIIREHGLVVSLDMARPDPRTESGRVDWISWMKCVLPHVDVFGPSLDELLFMLDRPKYEELVGQYGAEYLMNHVDIALLQDLASRLLEMGVPVVALKLGEEGLYLRTTENAERLRPIANLGDGNVQAWQGRELLHSCFNVKVTGTTGSGDTTLAGFLAGLAHGLPPEQILETAVAVGACSVESSDATSQITTWSAIKKRINAGWSHRPSTLMLPGWHNNEAHGLYWSLRDSGHHDGSAPKPPSDPAYPSDLERPSNGVE